MGCVLGPSELQASKTLLPSLLQISMSIAW